MHRARARGRQRRARQRARGRGRGHRLAAVPGAVAGSQTLTPIPVAITNFSTLHARSVADWSRRLGEWKDRGERVVLWGSGGKGVNFLNSVNSSEVIAQVVDINPDRQGKFVPGSGQKIVPPLTLQDDPPDIVILTNPIYKEEVQRQMKELGVDCELIIA